MVCPSLRFYHDTEGVVATPREIWGALRIDLVGAWKSEQVQDVHELIAPADRLSLVRRLPDVAS
jgi:hypothetical protein